MALTHDIATAPATARVGSKIVGIPRRHMPLQSIPAIEDLPLSHAPRLVAKNQTGKFRN